MYENCKVGSIPLMLVILKNLNRLDGILDPFLGFCVSSEYGRQCRIDLRIIQRGRKIETVRISRNKLLEHICSPFDSKYRDSTR